MRNRRTSLAWIALFTVVQLVLQPLAVAAWCSVGAAEGCCCAPAEPEPDLEPGCCGSEDAPEAPAPDAPADDCDCSAAPDPAPALPAGSHAGPTHGPLLALSSAAAPPAPDGHHAWIANAPRGPTPWGTRPLHLRFGVFRL